MKVFHLVLALGIVALGTGVTAEDKKPKQQLPEDAAAILEKATELEVYSLNGEPRAGEKTLWHGAQLLGKTTVKKDADRKALAAAVKGAIEEGGKAAKCFIPRHGIRAKHDGKTVDFVICFECGWVHIFVNGEQQKPNLTIAGTAEKQLNDILTAATIPLDKSKK